jgi:hypothetical protein
VPLLVVVEAVAEEAAEVDLVLIGVLVGWICPFLFKNALRETL